MSANTLIQWAHHSFNIVWGCIKVSPGCENCYAATMAKRLGLDIWGPAKTTPRRTFGAKHWAEPLKWNAAAERAGERRRVFCSSMADIGEDHPTVAEELKKLWPLIKATPWLDWLLLTKRPERYPEILPDDWGEGYDNVWLGTSVESQAYVWRAEKLREVKARVYFISAEPLLEWVSFWDLFRGLGPDEMWWLIIGGESGTRARPFDIGWVISLLRECSEFGVYAFVKQLGAVPMEEEDAWRERVPTRLLSAKNRKRVPAGFVPLKLKDSHGGTIEEWPEELRVREFPVSGVRA